LKSSPLFRGAAVLVPKTEVFKRPVHINCGKYLAER
jgi:hypothetical protein